MNILYTWIFEILQIFKQNDQPQLKDHNSFVLNWEEHSFFIFLFLEVLSIYVLSSATELRWI